MGTFKCDGIAAEMERFNGLAKGTDEACRAAVKAGGKLLAQKLSDAAPVYHGNRRDVTPGALKKSLKAGKVGYNAADGWHCSVAPKGEDHGENLAKIGNVLEYGRSDMAPRPWFNTTVARAEADVTREMQRAFEEAQGHE